jgi:hypothetical protein
VSQKLGPTKTFQANLWKYYFLLVCFGCYVNDVCLSYLLNTIVSQHNPCALVIMLLLMLLAIFPKPLSWQTLLFIQIISFIQISAKVYFLETKLLSKLSIYKIIWTYKVEWSHCFTNFYFVDIYKRISNNFEKILQRRYLCLHLFLKLSTKALLLYLKLFST